MPCSMSCARHLLWTAYQRHKAASLSTANLALEVARHLRQIAHDLGAIPLKCYAHGAKLMDDLDRQIGGRLRSRPRSGTEGGKCS